MGVYCKTSKLLRDEFRVAGRDGSKARNKQSMDCAETDNTRCMCRFTSYVGMWVNTVCLSSREAPEEMRWHRNRGKAPVYIKTCARYLFLTYELSAVRRRALEISGAAVS